MKQLRRPPLTILEVLISMALTMLAITTLLYFYYQVDEMNRFIEKIEEESFQSRYLEGRLAALLPRAVGENDPSKDFMFMSTEGKSGLTKGGMPTLLFMYDNGIDLNPDFANHVLGRLYLDEKENLTLATWPAPARWRSDQPVPMRKESLFQHVKELRFKFFVPPQKDVKSLFENEGWIDQWKEEYKQLPALISVEIVTEKNEKEETIRYLFPLANTKNTIRYER